MYQGCAYEGIPDDEEGFGSVWNIWNCLGKQMLELPLTVCFIDKEIGKRTATYVVVVKIDIVMCRWTEDSAVTITSTIHGCVSSSKAIRYSQKEKNELRLKLTAPRFL